MSSNVRQGFQSWIDPKLAEPLVLRLKLAPPKPNFTEKNDDKKQAFEDSESENNLNGELGGWSFIQSLTNTTQNPKNSPEKHEKIYVHPLTKRSASMMSEKSLEMCTESLGSESGSDISESSMDDNFSCFSDNADLSPKSSSSKNLGTSWAATKKTSRRSFPPPLTSISVGGDGSFVRVKPHREGGRLVIKAVTVFATETVFRAERGNGRLRLHMLKGNTVNPNPKNEINDDGEIGKKDGGDVVEDETECEEGMDGDIENLEGKMGIEKFQNKRRCKENGHKKKGLWNLEACLVASI